MNFAKNFIEKFKKVYAEDPRFYDGYFFASSVAITGMFVAYGMLELDEFIRKKKRVHFIFHLPICEDTKDQDWNFKLMDCLRDRYKIIVDYPHIVTGELSYNCYASNKKLYEQFKKDADFVEFDSDEQKFDFKFLIPKKVYDKINEEEIIVSIADWAKPFFIDSDSDDDDC